MRRRLVAAIAAVAAFAVVLFAIPLAVVLDHGYRDEDLLRLQRDTVAATRGIDVPGAPGDRVELPAGADALAVYDRSGHLVSGHGPPAAPAVVREALSSGRPAERAHSGQLEAAVPLVVGERVTGAVRALRSGASAARDTHGAWLVIAGLAAAVIVAAAAAAVLLGRRLALPLERLAATAGRLGEGDFSARAPRSRIAEVDGVGSALDTTAARLGALVARERAFTTNASHQLRTPLAALRLELEALALRDGDTPEIASALAQVDRLQSTIDTLLAVARAPRRSGVAVDLVRLMDDAEARWRDALALQARPLHSRSAARRPIARGSRRVLDEIVDVLVDNARVHGDGAVTLSVREVDGWLALDVADQGPGFAGDPERAITARDGGHGIGLALARTLAHAEGGRLVVSSAGPAPVLTLLLPAAVDA